MADEQADIDTGFSRHIDVLVDREGQRPDKATMDHIRSSLGKPISQKWFDVTGRGYEKNWMYVAGVK